MFNKGDKVRIDPYANYLSVVMEDGLSVEETYVVEDVDTSHIPHDDLTGIPERDHTTVRLQGDDDPDRWYDAGYFIPA